MFNKNILIQTTVSLTLVAVVAVLFSYFNAQSALGSTVMGNDYEPFHITSADIGSSTVKSLAGSIGSIVVSSSTNSGTINFYQVSSSTSPTATSSNTLMFTFNAGADEGTYQYDVAFGGGLLIDITPGFNGNYVLTWR